MNFRLHCSVTCQLTVGGKQFALSIYSYTLIGSKAVKNVKITSNKFIISLILVTITETSICITQFSSGQNKGRNPHLPVRFLPQLPEVSQLISFNNM